MANTCALQLTPAAEAPMFLLMQNWQLPQELSPLADYTSRMRSRDSWSGTSTPNSHIVQQWCAHNTTAEYGTSTFAAVLEGMTVVCSQGSWIVGQWCSRSNSSVEWPDLPSCPPW